MKIADLQVRVVGNPWKNWVLVKILTDEGLVGWGDATTPMSYKPVVSALEEMRTFCIGKDPLRIEALWDEIYKTMYLPNDGTLLSALAGIETACWDVLGQALDVPLHQLFGGLVNSKIKAYANGWYTGPREKSAYAQKAAEVVERGYKALKLDPFGAAHRYLGPEERSVSLGIVRAIRETVGDNVDLMIEVHDRLTPVEAIRLCREVEEFSPLWIEAPVLSNDIRALETVAEATSLRIVAGERFTNLREFADLLSCNRIDVLQPEYVELGGLHRLRQVAGIAEAYQAMVAPHNARCPVSTAANVHFDAATRNVFIQETFDDYHVAWSRDVFEGVPAVVDGCFSPSTAPGLGVKVNEEFIERHPPGAANYINLFGEGWEQRKGR